MGRRGATIESDRDHALSRRRARAARASTRADTARCGALCAAIKPPPLTNTITTPTSTQTHTPITKTTPTARERIVGWYSTGPRLREADVDVNELVAGYCDSPVLVVCEVEPKDVGLPFAAYCSVSEVREDGTEKARKVFASVPTEVGQTEAEEVGVEHLLRDVKDATVSTLATDVAAKLQALRGLRGKLGELQAYLGAVADGRLPVNHDISALLQDALNLLPNASAEHLTGALAVKGNDMMAVVYVAALARAVLAMHRLVDNREARAAREKARADKLDKDKADKAAAAAGKDGADGEAAAAAGKDAGSGEKDGSGGAEAKK